MFIIILQLDKIIALSWDNCRSKQRPVVIKSCVSLHNKTNTKQNIVLFLRNEIITFADRFLDTRIDYYQINNLVGWHKHSFL